MLYNCRIVLLFFWWKVSKKSSMLLSLLLTSDALNTYERYSAKIVNFSFSDFLQHPLSLVCYVLRWTFKWFGSLPVIMVDWYAENIFSLFDFCFFKFSSHNVWILFLFLLRCLSFIILLVPVSFLLAPFFIINSTNILNIFIAAYKPQLI